MYCNKAIIILKKEFIKISDPLMFVINFIKLLNTITCSKNVKKICESVVMNFSCIGKRY